jgi:PadR family transcriptional regulator, regulatory protein PadR
VGQTLSSANNHAIDCRRYLPYNVVQMARPDSIGQFEQLVLTAILSLKEDAYGVTVHEKVGELARPKQISLGAVYVTLDRLEDKGFISSWLSEPTAERGGRAKRCYRMEALGERALQESAATAMRIIDSLVQALGKDWARNWGKRWGKEAG